MTSFFGKLRPGSASPSSGASAKKDPSAIQQTPLEKLLESAGPIRNDGSDKFFGMENFGSTCYCNSILQCLYYSVPFREQVLRYPNLPPAESLIDSSNGLPRINTNSATVNSSPNTAHSPISRAGGLSPATSPAKKPLQSGPQGQPGIRPEDKPDTPEYKKKQAMMAGPILSMDYDNASNYGMTGSLFTSLKDIFEAILKSNSRTGVVSPKKLLEVLKSESDIFNSGQHQDAHEFLNLLLNQVVNNVKGYSEKKDPVPDLQNGSALSKTNSSVSNATTGCSHVQTSSESTGWVHDLFEGILTSETKCLTCENVSQRDEPFLDLSVDIEQHSSVSSCLRKFSEEEMLCERNKFHCDNCSGLQEAERRMKIKRLPRILALHLKRFKYTGDLQRLQKLFHRVVYPFYLRLFNTSDEAEDPDRLYELYAVVVHIGGGPYHGHYVSIIKTNDRGWLLFDDEMVEPVHKSFVQNFFGNDSGLASAYVLFYQETTLEAVQKEQEAEGIATNSFPQTAKDGTIIKPMGVSVMNPLQHVQSSKTPVLADHDQFASLDHAATAPAQSPEFAFSRSLLEEAGMASSASQAPSPKPGDARSKKERAEEEKKNKMAEKEREKVEKQRVKDLEVKRKEYEKIQKNEIQAAIAASKQSKAEEDLPLGKDRENINGSSSKMSNGLSRFRHGSKSIKGKSSKLFGSKDGKEDPRKDTKESPDEENALVELQLSPGIPTTSLTPEKPDKPKGHRFSLRKKSSHMFG